MKKKTKNKILNKKSMQKYSKLCCNENIDTNKFAYIPTYNINTKKYK